MGSFECPLDIQRKCTLHQFRQARSRGEGYRIDSPATELPPQERCEVTASEAQLSLDAVSFMAKCPAVVTDDYSGVRLLEGPCYAEVAEQQII